MDKPAPKPYKTVGLSGQDEFIINKSRFIGACRRCVSEEEALAFLAARREQYRDASHNCYAYVIGRNKGIMRYSDDGEPGGTAGMPIMEVLRARDVTDCCVVVTRYFGGILLGAGGLVRAYSRGCAAALSAAGVVEMRPCTDCMTAIPYSLHDRFMADIKAMPLRVLEREYGGDVTLTCRMPAEALPDFAEYVRRITSGAEEPVVVDEGFFEWDCTAAGGGEQNA